MVNKKAKVRALIDWAECFDTKMAKVAQNKQKLAKKMHEKQHECQIYAKC